MSRGYRAVFDHRGKAYEFVDGECVFIREDLCHYSAPSHLTPNIMPDLPDFVSPIDGTVVSGRAGLREHCLKHNVIPLQDLKGLPPKMMNQEYKLSRQEREATKRTIAEIINSRSY